MSIKDLVDLIYEDNSKNIRKREILLFLLKNIDKETGTATYILREKIKKQHGKYGIKLFYQVLNRLKDLGICKVRIIRDLETGRKIRYIEFTPDAFEYKIRQIIRSLRGK